MNTREPTGLALRRQRENVKSRHHASTFTSSCPAKRGRGTTLRSRVVEGASASTSLGRTPPPPPFGWSPSPALRAGADKAKSFSRRTHAPELCQTTTTPKIDSLPAIKEGSGAPKGACHPCPRCANKCTQLAPLICYAAARPQLLPPRLRGRVREGRARLSALTLAALATGYHPDGSAPEPGFPKTDLAGVLPAWPSCLRLSTLRADRSLCRSTGDPEPPGTKAKIFLGGFI